MNTCVFDFWHPTGLTSDLKKAGFANRGGKGSHRNFLHSKWIRITISGKLGADAKTYQEKDVMLRSQKNVSNQSQCYGLRLWSGI
ncbi:MAG TPA: type II toxin-antitoxin system HicA family toxin [Verrucomicrobiales bacterium]|nr:type II toxin-antitoxin system HicA family toxin [Verrucomicrobiales bacterium]